ncbi:MAG: OmpH family outer membrane protein [Nitrospinae bacterium]|nr:OmpH family outer membrane protein [Nitrospinota bacterium]
MRNLVIIILSTFFLLGGSYSYSQGESLKIGYVELQKALSQSVSGKLAMERLKKEIEKENTILKEKEEELKKLEEELNKQGLMMMESERNKKTEDLRRRSRDVERYKEDTRREIMLKEREMTQRIISELIKLAQKIGQEDGFTIILERGDTVLFAADSINLTDKLIKRYDEQKK